MDPAATIRAYYETLRRGDPLEPYFVADSRAVKFGITERLTGYEAISEGLRTQTETTTDWVVESHDLVVGERPTHAWFGDSVTMAWTDVTTGERHDYETRWSGALTRRNDRDPGSESGLGPDTSADSGPTGRSTPEEWGFLSMHVSRPGTLDDSEQANRSESG